MDRDVDGIECLGLEENGEEKRRFESENVPLTSF